MKTTMASTWGRRRWRWRRQWRPGHGWASDALGICGLPGGALQPAVYVTIAVGGYLISSRSEGLAERSGNSNDSIQRFIQRMNVVRRAAGGAAVLSAAGSLYVGWSWSRDPLASTSHTVQSVAYQLAANRALTS